MENQLPALPAMGDTTNTSQHDNALQLETEEEVRQDVEVIKLVLANQPALTQEMKEKMPWHMSDPFQRRHGFAGCLYSFTSWARFENFYRSRTWGFTIIRTVYGDGWDPKVQIAVSAIRRTIQAIGEHDIDRRNEAIEEFMKWSPWPEDMPKTADRRIEDEFERRLVNEVFDDRELFADATVEQVRAYFLRWAQEHFDRYLFHTRGRRQWPADALFRNCEPCSPRLFACILLDAETVEQLQGVPESPAELYPRLGEFWFKMVEAQPVPRQGYYDDGSVCDMYRVRLADLVHFWLHTSDTHPQETTEEPDPHDRSIRYYNPYGWIPPDRKRIITGPPLDPEPASDPAPSEPIHLNFWHR
ncbi:TRI7-trichothecene biosynthesis [Apiospora arundinis]|uniref:TRI7-trichothecene biosynthesis n=1 Tax=Apiospora arundinis TaxID=335852 RepID=A0ABR2JBI3_9PEZI